MVYSPKIHWGIKKDTPTIFYKERAEWDWLRKDGDDTDE